MVMPLLLLQNQPRPIPKRHCLAFPVVVDVDSWYSEFYSLRVLDFRPDRVVPFALKLAAELECLRTEID